MYVDAIDQRIKVEVTVSLIINCLYYCCVLLHT